MFKGTCTTQKSLYWWGNSRRRKKLIFKWPVTLSPLRCNVVPWCYSPQFNDRPHGVLQVDVRRKFEKPRILDHNVPYNECFDNILTCLFNKKKYYLNINLYKKSCILNSQRKRPSSWQKMYSRILHTYIIKIYVLKQDPIDY